jgi:ABC-type uncharacterized transport system permease subunit
MFPQYSAIALYILLAILCYRSKAALHWFYPLCTIAIANHILIIATYPNTNQAAIVTLVIATFAICNYILTNKTNITLWLLSFVIICLIANITITPRALLGIHLHIIMSCMLGAVITLAALQAYCIFIQNYRLKQATTPEENLLPLTMLGAHLKNTAVAGITLTTALAISGLYNMGSYHFDEVVTTKIVLTLIIWLLFAALILKKSIIKISLAEKSFLMTLSVILSITACGFCIYLG